MKTTLRYIIIVVLCGFCLFTAQAQTRNRQYEEYIHKYKDIAVEEMKRYRIPASITLAQGLLESGAGKVLYPVSRTIISALSAEVTGQGVQCVMMMMPVMNASVLTSIRVTPMKTIPNF